MPIFKKLASIVDMVNPMTGQREDIDKPYLILIVQYNSIPDPETGAFTEGEFKAIKGRRDTFDYLSEEYGLDNIDLLNSYILSGGLSFGEEVNLYIFLRLCVEKYQYADEMFLEDLHRRMIELSDNTLNEEILNKRYREELTKNIHSNR